MAEVADAPSRCLFYRLIPPAHDRRFARHRRRERKFGRCDRAAVLMRLFLPVGILTWRHFSKERGYIMFQTKSGREITYYGKEYTKDIKRSSGKGHKINTIDELFHILLDVWCKETAYPSCQKEYDQKNDPTYGQCAITATLVHDMFGGTINRIRVSGGGTHYFNRINGHDIDLTSDQFDLYDIAISYAPNEEIPREYCGKNADTLKRYKLLVERINNKVNNAQL